MRIAMSTCAYVERNEALMPDGFGAHDPMPRVALVPGVGAITTGTSPREAEVAADIALHTHSVAATVLDAFGTPEPLSDVETFRFDYWPMELYKLSLKPAPAEFSGRIMIVTGAASGIGRGIALELAAQGARGRPRGYGCQRVGRGGRSSFATAAASSR